MSVKFPVIDCHCDIVIPFQELGPDFDKEITIAQTNLILLKKANVKLIFAGFSFDDLLKNSFDQLKDIQNMIKQYPNDFELVTNFSQVEEILAGNKIGVIIHLEGAAILNNNLENLTDLYKQGIRSLGFTHNTKNSLATGAVVDDGEGLTEFGKRVIDRCNELKMVLDLSHLNEAGFYDVINISNKIPIVSHANCAYITNNKRNLTDQQLKKLSDIGSAVGVFFSAKYLKADLGSEASLGDALAHLKHMVRIMGANHIALGSDFGGITTGLPKGLENHSQLESLFESLHSEGFETSDLEKLAYKNVLRLLKQYI